MALSFETGKDTIEVISSKDPSIDCDAEAYKRYLESNDEAILNLKAGSDPTRFVMRRVLPYGAAQKIKTEQADVGPDGTVNVRLGYIMDEIRAALVDVKNPGSENLKFKKDSDGQASKELIVFLDSVGLVNELYAARQGVSKQASGPLKKS